jgi:hypothetical protein
MRRCSILCEKTARCVDKESGESRRQTRRTAVRELCERNGICTTTGEALNNTGSTDTTHYVRGLSGSAKQNRLYSAVQKYVAQKEATAGTITTLFSQEKTELLCLLPPAKKWDAFQTPSPLAWGEKLSASSYVSKSKLYYDRRSVCQSALVSGIHLGPVPNSPPPISLIIFRKFPVCWCGAPSLMRGLLFLIVAGHRQRSLSRVWVPRDSWSRFLYLFPSGTGYPNYTPRSYTLVSTEYIQLLMWRRTVRYKFQKSFKLV